MKKGFAFADLKYVDLLGKLHHLTIPIDRFNIKKGYGIDGSSIPGFTEREQSDLVIVADPRTEFVDPFFDDPTISYFADIYLPDGRRLPADPRFILERAVKLCRRLGQAYFLPEFEFYLFSRLEIEHWQGGMSISHETDDRGSYHSASPDDPHLEIRNRVTNLLKDLGIRVRYHHHEIGQGQQEVELVMTPINKVCDDIVLARYAIGNIARRNGLTACFLAKPLADQSGSGFHLHHTIKKKGRSIFGKKAISKIGRQYLAGILAHARALTPFANPSTNSYRRFDPDYEAPTETDFSPGNRTALIRLPEYAKEMEFEYRPADSICNPYLLISCIICAGVDGIENRIDLDRIDILPLPRDLFQAIEFLQADMDFLKRVMDRDVIDHYLDLLKYLAGIIRQNPHPVEFEIYQ